MLFDKQEYTEYLSGTRKSDGTINEYLKILDNFHGFNAKCKNDTPESSDIAVIESFLAKDDVEHGYTVFCTVLITNHLNVQE